MYRSIARAGLLALAAGCGADATAAGRGPEPAPTSAIPRGATWAYAEGGDRGTAWTAPSYDDTAWPRGAGPLGYGETYLTTVLGHGTSPTTRHVTTYFRAQFDVVDPGGVRRLLGEALFDDGIVVFLNGTPIARDSMPAGPTTATTRALGHEAGANQPFDWSAHTGLLVTGVNTVAVEVHQSDPASNDLVFDLSVHCDTSPPPPPRPLVAAGTRDDEVCLGDEASSCVSP